MILSLDDNTDIASPHISSTQGNWRGVIFVGKFRVILITGVKLCRQAGMYFQNPIVVN